MEFSDRLLATRIARGMTQAELAERAAISPSYLGQLEAGRYQPTLEVLKNLAVTLSISIDELAFDSSERARRSSGRSEMARLLDAVAELDRGDREAIRRLVESMIYRHEAEAARSARKRPGPKPKAR